MTGPQLGLLSRTVFDISLSTWMMTSHVIALRQSPGTVEVHREHTRACVGSPELEIWGFMSCQEA